MGRHSGVNSDSGLEVALPIGLERTVPPNYHIEDKIYSEDKSYRPIVPEKEPYYQRLAQPKEPEKPERRICGYRPAFWILTIITIFCLAAALGGGLGGGLAARRRSSTAPQSSTNVALPATGPELASTLASPTSTAPTTSTPATSTTSSTFKLTDCPSADNTTYTATNRPLPTLGPITQISNTTLEFEVACNTNWANGDSNVDVQTISNVTSLQSCIDTCAQYTWQSPPKFITSLGCSAVVWGNGRSNNVVNVGLQDVCILKTGISASSFNDSSSAPGFDGAFLIYPLVDN